uniref:RlsC n=1 Tax=Pandorina morum TaxID=33099 RepID=A0A1W5IVR2_PANMO|nr:rlsC [Pandorina morum]
MPPPCCRPPKQSQEPQQPLQPLQSPIGHQARPPSNPALPTPFSAASDTPTRTPAPESGDMPPSPLGGLGEPRRVPLSATGLLDILPPVRRQIRDLLPALLGHDGSAGQLLEKLAGEAAGHGPGSTAVPADCDTASTTAPGNPAAATTPLPLRLQAASRWSGFAHPQLTMRVVRSLVEQQQQQPDGSAAADALQDPLLPARQPHGGDRSATQQRCNSPTALHPPRGEDHAPPLDEDQGGDPGLHRSASPSSPQATSSSTSPPPPGHSPAPAHAQLPPLGHREPRPTGYRPPLPPQTQPPSQLLQHVVPKALLADTGRGAAGGSATIEQPSSSDGAGGQQPETARSPGAGSDVRVAAAALPPVRIEVTVAIRGGPVPSGGRLSDAGLAGEESRAGYVRGPVCGLFDVGRYLEGRDCVLYGGRWLSRSHFEKLGGSKMAKWYRSIRVLPDLEPLGEWLERHKMPVTKGPARRSSKRPYIPPGDVAWIYGHLQDFPSLDGVEESRSGSVAAAAAAETPVTLPPQPLAPLASQAMQPATRGAGPVGSTDAVRLRIPVRAQGLVQPPGPPQPHFAGQPGSPAPPLRTISVHSLAPLTPFKRTRLSFEGDDLVVSSGGGGAGSSGGGGGSSRTSPSRHDASGSGALGPGSPDSAPSRLGQLSAASTRPSVARASQPESDQLHLRLLQAQAAGSRAAASSRPPAEAEEPGQPEWQRTAAPAGPLPLSAAAEQAFLAPTSYRSAQRRRLEHGYTEHERQPAAIEGPAAAENARGPAGLQLRPGIPGEKLAAQTATQQTQGQPQRTYLQLPAHLIACDAAAGTIGQQPLSQARPLPRLSLIPLRALAGNIPGGGPLAAAQPRPPVCAFPGFGVRPEPVSPPPTAGAAAAVSYLDASHPRDAARLGGQPYGIRPLQASERVPPAAIARVQITGAGAPCGEAAQVVKPAEGDVLGVAFESQGEQVGEGNAAGGAERRGDTAGQAQAHRPPQVNSGIGWTGLADGGSGGERGGTLRAKRRREDDSEREDEDRLRESRKRGPALSSEAGA